MLCGSDQLTTDDVADWMFYKASAPALSSLFDDRTLWRLGRITRHPSPNLSQGLCSSGVLHASDAMAETLSGGRLGHVACL